MVLARLKSIALCMLMLTATSAMAAERPALKAHTVFGRALQKMSDNGKWALGWGAETEKLSPVLIDIEANKEYLLQTEAEIQKHDMCLAYDITDDGNIVVGTYEAQPAYLNRATGVWTKLPCKMASGALHSVTPDGKYAVGTVANADVSGIDYTLEQPAVWDLTTGQDITPTDLPKKDPDGTDLTQTYVRMVNISPDGRYIIMQSLADHYFTYIYDREAEGALKWSVIGYNTADGSKFSKQNPAIIEVSPAGMSPNGKWALVDVRMNVFSDEYVCAGRYNIETKALEVFADRLDDMDKKAGCIDNDGNVYGATPAGNPIREFYVRKDGYWFSLRTILKTQYGMDFEKTTGYTNTGTPMAVSADGRTFISFVDPQYGENYTMVTNEALVDICSRINLLSNYFLSPEAGAEFSRLSQIRVTFDREVEVIGDQTAATFGEWTSTSTNGIKVDPTDPLTVIVTFRTRTLEGGTDYTFTIPAGTICIKGDKTRLNEDIIVNYKGRSSDPVKPVSIYPTDGSVLAKIDNNSSPVQMTMNTDVITTDKASAALYGSDGKQIAQLTVATEGKTLQLYPATTQYLFAGEQYKVVLAAGSVTDVSGSGANEEITINYQGSYEREVSPDNAILFYCDFSNLASSLATWMLYDNDGYEPAEMPQSLEFDAKNTPWNFSIRDDEGTDFCAASHSMYNPAGKSDDWMVTPQLYIPDDASVLSFDAQSYLKSKNDILKVMVWECNDKINVLNAENFQRMSSEAKAIFEETLSPGKDENTLEGDWETYSISLAQFAGKSIYIAFVNQNTDQSMIFLDNVIVTRDMAYLLTLSNKQTVINETSINIGGKLTVNSPLGFTKECNFTLVDAAGKTVDEIKNTIDGTLKNGESIAFAFSKPLPLTIGEENKFVIKVEYTEGDKPQPMVDEVKSSVMSLTFNPVKRVVLEEMTGTTCGNCPQGILAIDKMKEMYGEQFIPISIHTYDGDAWGTGLNSYSSFLQLNGAPLGVVNRSSGVIMPMIQDPETFKYTMSYYGYLWMDCVAEELNNATYLDINAKVDADKEKNYFTLPLTVRSALNAVNLNLNVFLVLMEDKLIGLQHNYFSSYVDPIFGDWGKGGRYGQSTVPGITHNDVVRYVYGTTYNGTAGLLPQSMKAGEEYSTTISGELPGTYENLDNCKFAVILIDANTDVIVNACLAYVNPDISAISAVHTAAPASTRSYNLSGQPVSDSYKGVVIRDGKLVIRK